MCGVVMLSAQERDVLRRVVEPVAIPMVTVDDASALARLSADLAGLFGRVGRLGALTTNLVGIVDRTAIEPAPLAGRE